MSIDTPVTPVRSGAPEEDGPAAGVRTYVIDTSVLLSDPRAVFRFAEHRVVLPVVVITELEAKRHDPELGYFARKALRLLDDLRVTHGGLDRPVDLADGGCLQVELNHVADTVLPQSFRLRDNDSRILSVAANLSGEGHDVCVVSKDLPMRLKASALGLAAEEYRGEWIGGDDAYTGVAHLDVADDVVSVLYAEGRTEVPGAREPVAGRPPCRDPGDPASPSTARVAPACTLHPASATKTPASLSAGRTRRRGSERP